MAVTLSDTGRNAACDGFVDTLNSGKVKIYTTGLGSLLVTLTLNATAYGAAGASVAGRADANAITSGTAGNSGTAAEATICKSDDTVMATVSVGTSGADINLDSVSITAGQDVGLDTLYVTVPAS